MSAESKKGTKAQPKTVKKVKAAKKRKKQKRENLLKLYNEMIHMVIDAVDKEVVKRFKTIIDTIEDDIMKKSVVAIMREPKSVDLSSFSDSLQPYIKHYIYMVKRQAKKSVKVKKK